MLEALPVTSPARPARATRSAITRASSSSSAGRSDTGSWVCPRGAAQRADRRSLVSRSSGSIAASAAAPGVAAARRTAQGTCALRARRGRTRVAIAGAADAGARRPRAGARAPASADERRASRPSESSSAPATRRLSSSRSTLAGNSAQHRPQLGERPVPALGAAKVRPLEDPIDVEDDERHRAARRARAAPRPPSRSIRSAGSAPCGQRHHPQLELAPGGQPRRPEHRLLAGAVGIEAELEHRDDPLELRDLLLGQRGAHDPDRVAQPGLVQREHVGVALDEDHPPGLARRPRGPGRCRTAGCACGRARRRRCSGTSGAGPRASPAPRSRVRGRGRRPRGT